MDKNFTALRLNRRTASAAAMAAGGAAIALQPYNALAMATTGTGSNAFQIQAGKATWKLNNNITFNTSSSNWGFSDGSLTGGFNDAFDGAMSWLVATAAV